MENNPHTSLEGRANSEATAENVNAPPRWFKSTATALLATTQIAYLVVASCGVAEGVKREPQIIEPLLPVAIIAVTAGAFLIREGYSRLANNLAGLLYSPNRC